MSLAGIDDVEAYVIVMLRGMSGIIIIILIGEKLRLSKNCFGCFVKWEE